MGLLNFLLFVDSVLPLREVKEKIFKRREEMRFKKKLS
jgi:hypothetical protein